MKLILFCGTKVDKYIHQTCISLNLNNNDFSSIYN